MTAAEDFLLEHAKAPYDPAKAHAYYIRTRKLHPRKKSGEYVVNRGNGQTVKLSAKQLAEEKAYAEHRVNTIKGRLQTLNSELKKKLQAANKPPAKPTAADKSKAARDAKQYRDAHKQQLKNDQKQAASKSGGSTSKTSSSSKTHATTVESLKKSIVTTKASLKAAVEKQRELATSKRIG